MNSPTSMGVGISAVGSRGIISCHPTRKDTIETIRAVVVLPHNLLRLREALIGFRAIVAVLLKIDHLGSVRSLAS
jgi:hypothetical protein